MISAGLELGEPARAEVGWRKREKRTMARLASERGNRNQPPCARKRERRIHLTRQSERNDVRDKACEKEKETKEESGTLENAERRIGREEESDLPRE